MYLHININTHTYIYFWLLSLPTLSRSPSHPVNLLLFPAGPSPMFLSLWGNVVFSFVFM